MKKKLTSVLLLTVMLVSAISSAAVSAADNANEGNELVAADILDLSIDVEEQTVTNGSTDGQPIELSTNSNKGSITCEYDESIGMNVAKIRDNGYIKFDYATDAKDYTTNLQDSFTLEAYMSVTWDTTASATPTGHPLYSWVNEGATNGVSGFGMQAYKTNSYNLRLDTEVEAPDGTATPNAYNHIFNVESEKYFHLVFTYDQENKTTTLYVNGEEVKSNNIEGTLRLKNDKAKVIFWGCGIEYNAVPNKYIDTNVAVARIYDTALQSDAVGALYEDIKDKKMLTTYVQDNSAATEVQDKLDMRFIGSIDTPGNYQNAGFVFSLTNTNPLQGASGCVTRMTTKLYSTIMVDGNSLATGDVYGTDSTYMFAREITNVPIGTTIHIRPFVTMADGKIIYGDVRSVKVLGNEVN